MKKTFFLLMSLISCLMSQVSATDSIFTIQGGMESNQNEPLISQIATDVLKEGMGVVRFDFNGHGESDGDFQKMDALNIQDDLRRVIEWAEHQTFTKNIPLFGHSLGGIVAGMVAPELGKGRVKSVALLAPGGVAPDLMLMGNF